MPNPSRRQILSGLSTGFATLLAGCTAAPDESNATSTTTADGNSPTEPTQAVPEFPGDTASEACPPFDDAAQVVCYEAVDPEAMPVVLVPETQTVQLDQPTDFTLRNRSAQRFEANFYNWQLYKRVDGGWYYIMPRSTPQPLAIMAAGEDHTWTLTVTTGSVNDGAAIDRVQGTESLSADGLGGGHYAFATDGWFEAGSYEEPIALAASFDLQADPLQLTTTAAIAETEWDGETLVARSTRGEADNDNDEHDAYMLERIDDSEPHAEQIIIEQVVRDDQLRDAIALSREYDAARVRIEEFTSSIPPFGLDDSRIYEFQGERYQVTTRAGDST
ncbi:hypothetical protein HISP_09855 [Haloarcula hispanica N601]|uniref:Lipoprotein n=2 Tax=Haloarcula hispanica TaxID=51589 RepID=V5TSD2_HALHI|nr:hypothetical protein [Haloarcula hispanica]AEM57530.1 conserved hypothetical protein [Haloarcula hispanica ATCC 33960]AHB67499.1 hypothetical protein HISP_09855 [Haloarcula hispanica N601]